MRIRRKSLSGICLRMVRVTGVLAVVCAAANLSSCGQKKGMPAGQAGQAVPVAVGVVEQKAMPFEIRSIGNVTAYATVEIRARVGGALEKVLFQEGDAVSAGQAIFRIDPRPYEVAVKEAEAHLARDRATMEDAQGDLARASRLVENDYVSKEQYEEARATAASMKAVVEADEAALKKTRLDLSYCTIASPITGYTGDLLVDEGNLVKANDTSPMVVINQVQPIKVNFSVPEQYLDEIRSRQAKGPLRLIAKTRQKADKQAEGLLSFVDNAVDTQTGMILLKATFPNEDNLLWPGQFVDAVLTLGEQPDALVVPSRAIESGQQGPYVFVVRDDETVESRPVTVSRTLGEETVVSGGLQAGERVVTDGQLRLVSGTTVTIKTGEGDAVP